MEFFEVVQKRKSIRKYIPDKVMPEKDLQKILEIVSLAPSARNMQSYKIFVAKTKDYIEKIANACYNQRSDFVRNASAIFVFCTDPLDALNYFGERGKLYSLQDTTIAATYAILAATYLNYGSCWVGNFKEDEIKKILSTELTPVALIVIGFADEEVERKPRKSPEEIVKIV